MKILFISMPSIHVTRWMENLKDSGHELFWFDILNRGNLVTDNSVQQFSNWNKRKRPYIKGEYFLSKKAPNFYQIIRHFLEITENEALDSIIRAINPDVVHSFEMQSCSYPILKTMVKFPELKWIYSCWGNDIFYYHNIEAHRSKIRRVLQRVNYLHTDCERDFHLAKELGFNGKHVGVIPGGTGYKLDELAIYKQPIEKRNIILVKGYHHGFGRALFVIKALEKLKDNLAQYEIIVFGAHETVRNYIKEKNLNFKVFGRHDLSHAELMELMGKSIVYIGNNISDGMPNTLLEAIVMGVFPIQSNPGGATAEIITDGVNGFLIENTEDSDKIAELISNAVDNPKLFSQATRINHHLALERLDFKMNQNKIVSFYGSLHKL